MKYLQEIRLIAGKMEYYPEDIVVKVGFIITSILDFNEADFDLVYTLILHLVARKK